jgi:hypothetical protein
MIKYIELNSDDFIKAIEIIKKQPKNPKLFAKLNRQTYGGLITLDGTSEDIDSLCSVLKDNGIIAG